MHVMFNYLFVLQDRCKIPGLLNDTYAVQNDYHQDLIDAFIPHSETNGITAYSQCEIYVYYNMSHQDDDIGSARKRKSCDSWVYDWSTFTSTAAAEVSDILVNAWLTYRKNLYQKVTWRRFNKLFIAIKSYLQSLFLRFSLSQPPELLAARIIIC